MSTSSVVVGVRQLLLVHGPRVALVRVRTCAGGDNKAPPSSKYTTHEPCRICTHRSNDNRQVLSDNIHHHQPHFLETLTEVTDDASWILCQMCLSLVERLTRLTEEVEDIKARIKVVMKMTGSTTSQCPVTSPNPIKTKVSNSLRDEEQGQIPDVHEQEREEQDEEGDTPSSGGGGIQAVLGDEDDGPFLCAPEDIGAKGSDDDDDDDVKITCGIDDHGGEGDLTQEDEEDIVMPDPIQPDRLEPFARVHNTRSSVLVRCQGKVLTPQATLPNHTRGRHSSGYRSVCPICKISLRSSHVFNAHIHPDPVEDPDTVEYNCACGMSYESRSQYQSHWRKTHMKEGREKVDRSTILPCYFCGKRMRLRYRGHHMRGHTLERPFQCTTCGKDYVTSGYLRQHRCGRRAKARSKGRSSPLKHESLQCHICGKVYADSQNLRVHVRCIHNSKKVPFNHAAMKEEGFTCPECGKPFPHRESLKKHLKRVHLLDTRERQQCDICSQLFNSPDVFKAHTHPDPSDPTKFVFSCSICHKTFENSNRYGIHMTRIHKGVKKQCHHCGKLFQDNSGLQFHANSCHLSLEEARKCTFDSCGQVFPTLNERLDHERVVHKGLTSTKCFFCHRTFPTPPKLVNHLRTHTRERPFFCDKCGKDFPTWANLKIHMDRVCGGDEGKREEARRRKREDMRAFRAKLKYTCHLCDKRFGQKPQLIGHKKREHFGCL